MRCVHHHFRLQPLLFSFSASFSTRLTVGSFGYRWSIFGRMSISGTCAFNRSRGLTYRYVFFISRRRKWSPVGFAYLFTRYFSALAQMCVLHLIRSKTGLVSSKAYDARRRARWRPGWLMTRFFTFTDLYCL